jgi:hypothetical protein
VLLYLRNHAAAIVADPAVTVAALLRTTLDEAGNDEPPGWFEGRLRAGRCLVLLDGLDEVANQGDRVTVSNWARAQVKQYPDNDFVVSSRPRGYQAARVEGAEIVQVCGFAPAQVREFVHRWYQAAERHATGRTGPEVSVLARKGAGDLLRRLDQAPALSDLTVNPLLLTMIANVHRYRGALPGSRADLYAEICRVMLWARQDAKGLDQAIDGDRKVGVLRVLAYTMMEGRVADLGRAEVMATIGPSLRGLGGEPEPGGPAMAYAASPEGFVADVVASGLLVEREAGQYAFAHKTFQEYLAAQHIKEEGLADKLAATVGDDWWAETTLLYAAKSKADPIVAACLNAGTAPALALAFDCMQPGGDVSPALRERVHDLVRSADAPDADPQLRRLFAGILLTRHMRQRQSAAANAQVCLKPVQLDLYQLFMADTGTPPPDGPPAQSGTAAGPRAGDALAFAQWASGLPGGERRYRLPRAAELNEFASRGRIPADDPSYHPWVQPVTPGQEPALWPMSGDANPFTLENRLLADMATSDMLRSALRPSLQLLDSALHVRAVTRDLARDLERAIEREDAIERDRILANRSDRTRSLERDLNRAIDRAIETASTLPIAIEHARGLEHARARDRVLDLEHARRLEGDLERARGLARDRGLRGSLAVDRDRSLHGALNDARDVADEVASVIDRYLSSSLADAPGQRALDQVSQSVLRSALFSGIKKTLPSAGQPGTLPARVAEALSGATRLAASGSMTADPAVVEATLAGTLEELTAVIAETFSGRPDAARWRTILIEHLRVTAASVLARAERPAPEKTAEARLAALCLAAEADQAKRQDLGDQCRRIAAGITILQVRASGERPCPEVILLALAE